MTDENMVPDATSETTDNNVDTTNQTDNTNAAKSSTNKPLVIVGAVAVVAIIAVVAIVFAMSGNDSEDSAVVTTAVEQTIPEDSSTTTTTTVVGGFESEDPIAFRTQANVSASWAVRFDSYSKDATAKVASDNPHSTPPAAGNVYVLVEINVENSGNSDSSPSIDVNLVDQNGVEYLESNVKIPTSFDFYETIEAGSDSSGFIVFEVPQSEVDNLVIKVTRPAGNTPPHMYFALA